MTPNAALAAIAEENNQLTFNGSVHRPVKNNRGDICTSTLRYTLFPHYCVKCRNARASLWHINNPKQSKINAIRWRAENKEYLKVYSAVRRMKDKEKLHGQS